MPTERQMLERMENELNLKQLQLRSLLNITQAINNNISAKDLYDMYRSFLSWEMGIEKMALFVITDDGWKCPATINYSDQRTYEIVPLLKEHQRLYTVKSYDAEELQDFDIIIPVFHKNLPIAYSLIGGIKDKSDIYNKIQFITTITNIVAVALENKRLFKRQVEQEKYVHELKLATEVQNMLIPSKFPANPDYSLSKIYMPHSEVGGDYIDYIKLSDNKFIICIADISGKGVAAAILMANFQAKIHNLIYQYRDLETFVYALNQSVYNNESDKYITFFIAEVDTSKKEVRYVNAGHYPPVFYNNNKATLLDKGSTFIGAFESLPSIHEGSLNYNGDALLFTFTDGLAELSDGNNNYFDDKRIINFVEQNAALSAEDFNNTLMEEIDVFKGDSDFTDDIAILTCKLGSNGHTKK